MAEGEVKDPALENFRAEIGQEVNSRLDKLANRQEQLARFMVEKDRQDQQARAESRRPAAAPAAPSKETDERILNELVQNPTKFFTELASITRSNAAVEADNRIQEYQKEEKSRSQVGAFWNGFYNYNADLVSYAPMVEAAFRSQPPGDPSERANAAAEDVRRVLAAERQAGVEAERESRSNRGMLSGTPPGNSRQKSSPDNFDPEEDLRQTVDEMRALKERRMGY